MTKLHTLFDEWGQSPWIDNIRRDWLDDGTLKELVIQGVRGVTSNPTIFSKAVATSTAYDQFFRDTTVSNPEAIFELLAVKDVADVCDVLSPVFEKSKLDFREGTRRYLDGFVSLEVSPRLARDTAGTYDAARRLAEAVSKPNVMIKIPATDEGLPAITRVLGEGINVNVTLIFSVERYDEVIDAWMDGLELAAENGHDVGAIASVASFFVSRVDVAVDALLPDDDVRLGKIANSQVAAAYDLYRHRISSGRAVSLLAKNAQVQRPLWASTSPKNLAYFDLLHVESIIGDETVNTMSEATLASFLDHGNFSSSLLGDERSISRASATLSELPTGISLSAVSDQLEVDGISSFAVSYDELLDVIEARIKDRTT